MYTLQQIVDALSLTNPDFTLVFVAFCIANAIGLLEYIWAVRINFSEHKTPFPAWMHTFFFAHDFTAAIVLFACAFETNFFWLFPVYGGGMVIWTVLEFLNMRTIVLYEREELLGMGTTAKQAIIYLLLQVLVMFAFVNVMRMMMNDVAMFSWLPLTNFVMAVGPGYVLYKRRDRAGSSVFVYIMIVLGTLFNFAPAGIGFFSTVIPQLYNQPMWFIAGAVCTLISVINLARILKMPPKPVLPNGKKAIW
jgi:hypothetical protein